MCPALDNKSRGHVCDREFFILCQVQDNDTEEESNEWEKREHRWKERQAFVSISSSSSSNIKIVLRY